MAPLPRKLLKNGTVISFDEETQSIKVLSHASVLIEGDIIAAIIEDASRVPQDEDIEMVDISGRIVSPGFINTHTHMWQSVFRTLGPDVVLAQYFGWLSQLSEEVNKSFTPMELYVSCLQGYLEGINSGVTSIVEHAHNNWSVDVMKSGFDAAHDCGARVWWCFDIMHREAFSEKDQRAALARIAGEVVQNSLTSVGLALDGLAFSPDSASHQISIAKGMAAENQLKAFTLHHMGGPWPGGPTSPVEVCSRGLQDTKLPIIFSHAPYLTDEDMSTLREHDLFISITPESECHFGHGQMSGHAICDQASLGIDTNWTFSGDMITQARLWLQQVRSRNYTETLVEKGMLPRGSPMLVEEAFLLATRQGGRALRRPDIGVLRVGAKADLVTFSGGSPNMLGWSDPIAAIILHSNAGDVEHVLIDGKFRKRDFRLVEFEHGPSMSELKDQFIAAAKRLQTILKTPPEMPEKLWGVGKLGDVHVASTRQCPTQSDQTEFSSSRLP